MDDLQQRLRHISSKENVLVKELRHSFSQAELTQDGYCAIEGVRLLEEALRSGLRVKAVFFSHSARERAQRLLPQISAHADTLLLTDAVFRSAVATETPQGVAALVKLKSFAFADLLRSCPLILGAAGVQDPGNLGTIIRTAVAAGADLVCTTKGTVSARNAKVIRSSAGSFFRIPIVEHTGFSEFQRYCELHSVRLYRTDAREGVLYTEADLKSPCAILLGNEGGGIAEKELSVFPAIRIPMAGETESLNVAIAGAVILFEACRQRRSSLSRD